MAGLTRDTLECIVTKSAKLTAASLSPVVTCAFAETACEELVFVEITITVGCLECVIALTGELDGDSHTIAEICRGLVCGHDTDSEFKITITNEDGILAVIRALTEFAARNIPDYEKFTWSFGI